MYDLTEFKTRKDIIHATLNALIKESDNLNNKIHTLEKELKGLNLLLDLNTKEENIIIKNGKMMEDDRQQN